MDIEELAFKDRKILANLNAVDLLNIIEFLQDDRRQCLEEFSKTYNRSVEIQKKNQELKSQLKGTTHCFDEEEHNKLKEENQELKKQLEEKENIACNWKDSCLENAGKIEILETQQKEFIKYLEDEIKELQKIKETELDYDILKDVIPELLVFKDALQKYIEIVNGTEQK